MILVTGRLGFIESYTVASLIENNYSIVNADKLSNNKEDILKCLRKITV